MTRFIVDNIMNLVTPKAAAKHELLFDKPDYDVFRDGIVEHTGAT